MRESGKWKPKTLQNMRAGILAIWNHAIESDICEQYRKSKIRPIAVPRPVPVAWTEEELSRLLAASANLSGCFRSGINRQLYYDAAIRVAYDTGLRRGDLWRLSVSDVNDRGIVNTIQGKTREGHTCVLRQRTMDSFFGLSRHIHRLKLPHHKTPLLWTKASQAELYAGWGTLRDQAKVDKHGSFQMLRRTGATQVERNSPGAASRFLGHRTEGLAKRHYIDPSQIEAIQPPEIGDS